MAIPEGFAQVTHFFGGSQAPTGACVVYGVELIGYEGTILNLATELHDAFGDWWTPVWPASINLQRTLVKYGPDATGPSVEVGGVRTGTLAYPGTSAAVACLVQKRTDLGGKAGRGRMFVPGVVEGDVDASGVYLPANLAPIQTGANTFLTRLLTNDTRMVVLHQPGSPLTSPTVVESLQVQPVVATQRRRQRR
jgi:hypothetical protein